MKTKILTVVLVLSLATVSPRAQVKPQPQVVTCIMTWLALGLFAACAVACYYHAWNSDYSGPTNAPPALPPLTPDDPPDTQTNLPPLCTNYPPITLNALAATERLDVSSSNWVDCAGGLVTDLYRTAIEESTSPAGPWDTRYVVTHWGSAYGSTAVLESNGVTVLTNYARRVNGAATNYLPVALDRTAPAKFWRSAP